MALKKRLYQVNKMGVVLMTGCTHGKPLGAARALMDSKTPRAAPRAFSGPTVQQNHYFVELFFSRRAAISAVILL